MSGSSKNKEVKKHKKTKKKDKWQEAGGEFYTECYPGGQSASTTDLTVIVEQQRPTQPRPHIPLPSQTARRNSHIVPTTTNGRRGGGGYLTRNRKHTYQATLNGHNCMTYNSTMGRTMEVDEVHIALMPDLADETIPDEKSTYEALIKLKNLPEPMDQKRLRKSKLLGIPQRHVGGWKRVKWEFKKSIQNMKRTWKHDVSNLKLFTRSLRTIEVRCGTAMVNVFLFIRWTLLLNLFTAIVMSLFIILPYMAFTATMSEQIQKNASACSLVDQGYNWDIYKDINMNLTSTGIRPSDLIERKGCCTQHYYKKAIQDTRGALGIISRLMTNDKIIEHSPLFYGYYLHLSTNSDYDLFAATYALVITFILFISLCLMVRSVGIGVDELIMASEGEHHQYTNLILAGWDHHTRDADAAVFKRKLLQHEMKVALLTEKENFETLIRTRKDRLKLTAIRLFVNIVVLLLLAGAGAVIYNVSKHVLENKSTQDFAKTKREELVQNFFIGLVPSVLISVLNVIFPLLLSKIGKWEKYKMQTQTALVLIRSLFIRLMSIGFAAAGLIGLSYCEFKDSSVCVTCKPNSSIFNVKFAKPCWETLFADQLYKLIVVDLIVKIILTLLFEPLRVKLKKTFKHKLFQKFGNLKFSIVRHSLDIIYIQVLSWLGMYFGPFIPIFCFVYCLAVFYIKKFSLLHNCNQVPDTFKTTKTTTTFVVAKLLAFVVVAFVNVGVLGYINPSRGCGPFRKYDSAPWDAVNEIIAQSPPIQATYVYAIDISVTLPLTMILILLGYYYYSVAQANRGMVETLRHLLILEGHDKQYLFARLNSLRRENPNTATPSASRTTTNA